MHRQLENPILTPIFTHKRFRQPIPSVNRCGCGAQAKYEVYGDQQLHCHGCLLEAIETGEFVQVRILDGGFGDAS